jgi:PIN domain nuclease of toxin-antitoxin system
MIILDTHVWIWWVTESAHLSKKAARAIQEADTVGIVGMSCWEVAMLVAKRRIGLKMDVETWIELALRRPRVRFLSSTPKVMVDAVNLPDRAPNDPVDRLIIAECRHHGVALVTKDDRIRSSQLVEVVW